MVWVAPVGQELKFDEQFCVLAVQFRFGLFRRAGTRGWGTPVGDGGQEVQKPRRCASVDLEVRTGVPGSIQKRLPFLFCKLQFLASSRGDSRESRAGDCLPALNGEIPRALSRSRRQPRLPGGELFAWVCPHGRTCWSSIRLSSSIQATNLAQSPLFFSNKN